MKIVFATSNPHKLQELQKITETFGVKDIEFILPPKDFDPIENGTTFEENSLIKAQEANRLTGMVALADDSGLCVEALDGMPGIYSARYASTAQARIDKLLTALADKENRRAKFVCAMTLVGKNGKVLYSVKEECLGEISLSQAGEGGFGYDPIFLVDGRGGKTMAELSAGEKNAVSHRGQALRQVLKFCVEHLTERAC